MTVPPSPVLEFPAMLRGPTGTVRQQVSAQAQQWAREYLKTGGFTLPRRMLSVPPGEPLVVDAGGELAFISRPETWRVHEFTSISTDLHLSVPKEERSRMEETFEAFCLSTPWGALDHAVAPSPPWGAERTARRLTALLRFWDLLQGPRYAHWATYIPPARGDPFTLDGLMEHTYRLTLEAWCPGDSSSVRERLEHMVDRLTRATRDECLEAVLQVMRAVVASSKGLQHREVLGAPGFLRERLAALPPADFEDISSAYLHAASEPVWDWDRSLGRH